MNTLSQKTLLLLLPIFLFASPEDDVISNTNESNLTVESFESLNNNDLDLEEALRIEEDEPVDEENNNTETNSSNEDIETQESFLSSVEYGRMLYKNPRGISCSKCHGKMGKGGQKIAKYYDKQKNPKLLKGVDIRPYSLEELKASLKNKYRENGHRKRHKIMPIYYLTEKEIQAIYDYLQYHNKKEE